MTVQQVLYGTPAVPLVPDPASAYVDYASYFEAIDLSTLSPPALIEQLAYTDIFSALMRDFVSRDPTYSVLLESDPAVKLIEVVGYREHLLRQAFNDRAQQLLLAYAKGTNLDHLGAFYSCYRQIVTPAQPGLPPTPAVYESDDRYRARIQLAPEAFSCAGPAGAYLFHTYSASPGVQNAKVYNNASGLVKPGTVLVMLKIAQGFDPSAVLAAVRTRLYRSDIKPLTDTIHVKLATAANYDIGATLYVKGGPDAATVRTQARVRLYSYLALRQKVAELISLSGIYGALNGPYVERIALDKPLTDFSPGLTAYAYLNSLNLQVVRL